MDNTDIYYMNEALKEAKKAYEIDEVPVGCVIVKDGEIIARGHNKVENHKKAISHAEILAIEKASELIGDWRLNGCTVYATLEPCPMCAGALVRSRVDRLVIGIQDSKRGCAGSVYNLLEDSRFNHTLEVTRDVLADEAHDLLKKFFENKRNRTKQLRKGEANGD